MVIRPEGIGLHAVRLFLATIALLCSGLSSAADPTVTIANLLEHGDRYHQQPVSVIGEAVELKILTGPRNLPFYTFQLRDQHGSVSVMVQGKPEVSNGDQVFVHGVFVKSRKAGRTVVTNRIEATVVEQMHDSRQPLVG